MKILLVEDDSFYAQRITELLKDRDTDVTLVLTASEALDVDVLGFDGAIIDVMLGNDTVKTGITDLVVRSS